jgi:predicted GNAT superfamily acetyltransferase
LKFTFCVLDDSVESLILAPMAVATSVTVHVRDIQTPLELRACQGLQRRTWGITEDGYVIPVATMAAAQKVGGLVLGAFDQQEHLLGFAFAFLGRLNDQLVLYSQLAAVDPESQGLGIGRRLKLEQRERARQQGLNAVVWAFDPLQASNASFNLGVLGATCRTYEVDLYGPRSDALNAGLATDRLLAEWSTHDEPRPLRTAWPDAPELIETQLDVDGQRVATGTHAAHESNVTLEIPPHLAATKRSLHIAQAWQLHVRRAFQHAFAAGYVAVGFSRDDPTRPRYLLHRAT